MPAELIADESIVKRRKLSSVTDVVSEGEAKQRMLSLKPESFHGCAIRAIAGTHFVPGASSVSSGGAAEGTPGSGGAAGAGGGTSGSEDMMFTDEKDKAMVASILAQAHSHSAAAMAMPPPISPPKTNASLSSGGGAEARIVWQAGLSQCSQSHTQDTGHSHETLFGNMGSSLEPTARREIIKALIVSRVLFCLLAPLHPPSVWSLVIQRPVRL